MQWQSALLRSFHLSGDLLYLPLQSAFQPPARRIDSAVAPSPPPAPSGIFFTCKCEAALVSMLIRIPQAAWSGTFLPLALRDSQRGDCSNGMQLARGMHMAIGSLCMSGQGAKHPRG